MSANTTLGVLTRFAQQLTQKFKTLGTAQPEDQLKAPVENLIVAVGGDAGNSIGVNTESRVHDVGRPDLAVTLNGLIAGYVELKAPGLGADVRRFKGRNKQQWAKFSALPNLMYTDGNDWALYRNSELVGRAVLAGDVTEDAGSELGAEDASKLAQLIRDFLAWQPIVPTTPASLARLLAPLCHLLREDVRHSLSDPDSALSDLAREWRSYLFPDASDSQFADAYAQTFTYALLLARLSGARLESMHEAETTLRPRHHLLAQVLKILAQPEARREIAVGIDLLERTIAAVDPIALSKSGGDTWLYFYEDFLAAYDPKLRNERGVYYTPVQVVQAQVNLIADLLKNRLDRPHAFAEEGVLVLDPATGTGTYPLAALQHGLDLVGSAYGEGERSSAATLMAKNMFAFEILVGPYAVAHLRISERVIDAGGALPSSGAQVYLTDTLESPHATPPGQLPLQARALAEEHRRAIKVKRDVPIVICVGNPPYDREQRSPDEEDLQRKGSWVRFGEAGESIDSALLADFILPTRAAGAGVHLKNLYNDYVYFWRWALWKVLETKPGPGVNSFITASSYLRGPGFVGMREVMRRRFDELWIIDLGGDSRGTRRTENVFDIQTPVAIATGVRYGNGDSERPADVWYTKIDGTREAKLMALDEISEFKDLQWKACGAGWQDPFTPAGAGDYFSWPLLTDIFPWQHSGVQVKRSWPIAESEDLLRERWSALIRSVNRASAFRETRDRKIINSYLSLFEPKVRLPAIGAIREETDSPVIFRYAFRSLDRQWIAADGRVIDFPRPALWSAHSEEQIYLTSLLTETLGSGPAAVVAADIPDLHHFCGRGGKDIVPLWRDREATKPNVLKGLLDKLSFHFDAPVSPQDIFAYVYALIGFSHYTAKFTDELLVPGPRVPLTKDRDLFWRCVEMGKKIIALHTYGERFSDCLPDGEVPRGVARSLSGVPTSVAEYPDSFEYIELDQQIRVGSGRFGPVSPVVWKYSVSGLQVIKSWLDYRMSNRGGKSSSPLDEIRPQNWTFSRELLALIWVIEATIALDEQARSLFESVNQSNVYHASELPRPSAEERKAPDESGLQKHPLQATLGI